MRIPCAPTPRLVYCSRCEIWWFLCTGAELVHPLTEYPWGQRVVHFYDPDRHIVEVEESMDTVVRRFLAQGMSVEQTAEITQHPVEFVHGCMPYDKEEDT